MPQQPGMICARIAGALSLWGILLAASVASADEASDFFEAKIRPVLIEKCYECHSADSKVPQGGLRVDSAVGLKRGGDSGPALDAKHPEASLLLEAIRFESFEMPPDGKLPDSVIADFERWVAMGAPDPRTTEPEAKAAAYAGMSIEDGRQFWAFQPAETHVLPEVQNRDWAESWIDRFVLKQLEDAGVQPQADADPGTLLRRLSFDLVGLPPSEADIERIVYGDDPQAVREFVDRLLESPQFGEHWGRHWLDIARYADSNGGDFNATFHEAWRYRNYIIDAFNADRPFNELIVEQIAGDLLPHKSDAERERQLVATGFLLLGTKMLSERDKEKLRMDVVDEQVSAIGSAFLGMTLGCARCHDHKFDPVPTSDYYALAGILRSTQTLDGEIQKYVSNWVRQPLPIEPEHAAALKAHQEKSQQLKQQLKTAEAKLKELQTDSALSTILALGTVVDNAQAEVVGQWKESTYSKEFVGAGYIHDDRMDKGEKRVIFRAQLPADGEYEIRIAYPGSGGRATNVPVTIAHADGESKVEVDQTKVAPIERLLQPIGKFRFTAAAQAVVTISNEGTEGYVIVDAVQFVPIQKLEEDSSKGSAEERQQLAAAKKEVEQLKQAIKDHDAAAPPPAPRALAVNDASDAGDCNICVRGETSNLGPKVSRGFLSVAQFDEPPQIAANESGRLALAQWVADARNPLTARVYVNRVWKHLLGEGIVRSVDNFGVLGERPTHPDLLDQLAVEFIEHGWSTKWLVREIVLSHVYRLSSEHNEAGWSADPENRLLWRANRKRVSAESIRDAMLMAGGALDASRLDSPVAGLGTLVTQNRPDDTGYKQAATTVRTIYQPVIRNELPSLMRVFDFADPDFVTGERSETNVPAQALWMLNGEFVREQAELVAGRVLDRKLSTVSEQVEKLYLLAMGRPPTSEEAAIAQEFVLAAVAGTDDAALHKQAWSDLAHALFASSSFRMLD